MYYFEGRELGALTQLTIVLPLFSFTRWFAILIFGATYTANLAAFLTINKYDHPIKTVEDLANQNKIKFGTAPGQLARMLE